MEIKAAALRGVESKGMLASARELGPVERPFRACSSCRRTQSPARTCAPCSGSTSE
jgi:tRNA-binding EMAP/Myf-like protein